jgi:hypothetical protein
VIIALVLGVTSPGSGEVFPALDVRGELTLELRPPRGFSLGPMGRRRWLFPSATSIPASAFTASAVGTAAIVTPLAPQRRADDQPKPGELDGDCDQQRPAGWCSRGSNVLRRYRHNGPDRVGRHVC